MSNTPTRREFLSATAVAACGLAPAAAKPRAVAGPAKSCIFINLVGGPAHLDTFDPKPTAPSNVRGPFRPIPTRVPGIHLSELFPKLANLTDKFSLIRSMHHTAPPIHEAGFQLLNTGRLFRDGPEWPSVGCVWTHLHGERALGCGQRHYVAPFADVETGITIGKGFGPGFLGTHVAPQENGVNCAGFEFDTVPHMFNVNGDPRYGVNAFGFNCFGALKSVAKRPGRFLTLNMFSTVFDSPSWDCHADGGSLRTDLGDIRDTVAPSFDTAFAALLTDLDERGLLEGTLVVATGEFGRTPHLNCNGGRDHWANAWTAIVAGGGVKGGRVIGATDAHGTEPSDRPVTPQELVATIFHAMGVPQSATIPGPDGKPVDVYPGMPVTELF
ncbi:MAG TPA: DUF1501 domain-containing protein, partial [Gemmataceae bacterium]|nr:DUF1501 domain-containing protein [Gemmataceae bacterium]